MLKLIVIALFCACNAWRTVNTEATVLARIGFNATVQIPNPEYVRLLNHSIMFYEAQRSGTLPAKNRIKWRHDSALTDGSDANVDLTGGYYDAGDYLKFTFPLCYTVFMLCWGGTDYINGYQKANQTEYFRSQIKWATDWLIKAHPQPSELFVQVGNLQLDNNYFGPDTGIMQPRPSYQVNETHYGTDVTSMAATAFASAAQMFSTFAKINSNQEDTDYASKLLVHATQLYNSSRSLKPYYKYQKSVPGVNSAYGSTDYVDDLILSGIAMFRATNNQTYIDNALQLYKETKGASTHKEPLDWDNKWGAIYVLFAETLMDSDRQDEALLRRDDAENYLDGLVSKSTVNTTAGGLLFWNNYSNDNSNSNAMSASHLLLSYSINVLHPLAKISEDSKTLLAKAKRYEDLANSQLSYIFGKNPINQNYVVGERENSPKYPHSAPASGFNSLLEALAHPEDLSRAHTIYGALVGGPSQNDSFKDTRLGWSQTEVALDYNAPYQNLLAYQIMYSEIGPFYAPQAASPDAPTEISEASGMAPWVIAVAITVPLFSILLVILCVCLFKRNRNRRIKQHELNSTNGYIHQPEKSVIPNKEAEIDTVTLPPGSETASNESRSLSSYTYSSNMMKNGNVASAFNTPTTAAYLWQKFKREDKLENI